MNETSLFKYFIGTLVVVGAYVVLIILMFHDVPDGTRDVINNNIGIFIGMAVTVVVYEFGNSKNSSELGKMLANSQPIPDKSVTVSTTGKGTVGITEAEYLLLDDTTKALYEPDTTRPGYYIKKIV